MASRKVYADDDITKRGPSGFADEVLSRIAELYAIEADIRGQSSGVESQESQGQSGPPWSLLSGSHWI